jgi:hypothetical protein
VIVVTEDSKILLPALGDFPSGRFIDGCCPTSEIARSLGSLFGPVYPHDDNAFAALHCIVTEQEVVIAGKFDQRAAPCTMHKDYSYAISYLERTTGILVDTLNELIRISEEGQSVPVLKDYDDTVETFNGKIEDIIEGIEEKVLKEEQQDYLDTIVEAKPLYSTNHSERTNFYEYMGQALMKISRKQRSFSPSFICQAWLKDILDPFVFVTPNYYGTLVGCNKYLSTCNADPYRGTSKAKCQEFIDGLILDSLAKGVNPEDYTIEYCKSFNGVRTAVPFVNGYAQIP